MIKQALGARREARGENLDATHSPLTSSLAPRASSLPEGSK
jgi:hypothetical protein